MLSPLRLRRRLTLSLTRFVTTINRPGPPPLPKDQQREFEDLQRRAQAPLSSPVDTLPNTHPDAPTPLKPEFEGDVNPATGEKGGPKREPVKRWGGDQGGDWSFKGRVTDF